MTNHMRRLALCMALVGAACTHQSARVLTPSDAELFVQDIIAAGDSLPVQESGRSDYLTLCSFAQSQHTCEATGTAIVHAGPEHASASIGCSWMTGAGDVVVVVVAEVNEETTRRVETPILVHEDRGDLAVRHPFYWSGIGLAGMDGQQLGSGSTRVDTSVTPDSDRSWCPPN